MKTKINVWLKYYLDRNNKETFLNGTKSAQAAGYQCSSYQAFADIATKNVSKTKELVERWFEENGFSDEHIQSTIMDLLHADRTEYFTHHGQVIDERRVPAHNIRVQAARLAAKVKGMDAPIKHEYSGPGGGPLEIKVISDDTPVDEAVKVYSQMVQDSKETRREEAAVAKAGKKKCRK